MTLAVILFDIFARWWFQSISLGINIPFLWFLYFYGWTIEHITCLKHFETTSEIRWWGMRRFYIAHHCTHAPGSFLGTCLSGLPSSVIDSPGRWYEAACLCHGYFSSSHHPSLATWSLPVLSLLRVSDKVFQASPWSTVRILCWKVSVWIHDLKKKGLWP